MLRSVDHHALVIDASRAPANSLAALVAASRPNTEDGGAVAALQEQVEGLTRTLRTKVRCGGPVAGVLRHCKRRKPETCARCMGRRGTRAPHAVHRKLLACGLLEWVLSGCHG